MSKGRMARRLVLVAAAALCAAVVASPGAAGEKTGSSKGNSTAGVSVTFPSAWQATIQSTKGISHYVVELESGEVVKVELSEEVRELTVGNYASPIVSVEVKSGTTYERFDSHNPDDSGDDRPDYCDDPELDAWPEECW